MSIDYALIWSGLIAFSVFAYVVLDGFDLGVGMLFSQLKSESQRDLAMNTVAPVWDGNETWLVLGGGGLFAVFPLAYAVLLPALYAPITAMLLGLVLRGVAFEFRWRTRRWKRVWDYSFVLGSLLASLAQGITLGALVQGIQVEQRSYAGGWWDWLTPFSLMTGFALVIGYCLLGACWLVWKTEGELKQIALKMARIAGAGTVLSIILVSAWTPWQQDEYFQRWFTAPTIYFLLPIPLLVILCSYALFNGIGYAAKHGHHDWKPFLSAVGLFSLSFIGICVSFYPNLIPPEISLWDAAAPDTSLRFLLAGSLLLIPIIVAYTGYSYWVFRGKVSNEAFYH